MEILFDHFEMIDKHNHLWQQSKSIFIIDRTLTKKDKPSLKWISSWLEFVDVWHDLERLGRHSCWRSQLKSQRQLNWIVGEKRFRPLFIFGDNLRTMINIDLILKNHSSKIELIKECLRCFSYDKMEENWSSYSIDFLLLKICNKRYSYQFLRDKMKDFFILLIEKWEKRHWSMSLRNLLKRVDWKRIKCFWRIVEENNDNWWFHSFSYQFEQLTNKILRHSTNIKIVEEFLWIVSLSLFLNCSNRFVSMHVVNLCTNPRVVSKLKVEFNYSTISSTIQVLILFYCSTIQLFNYFNYSTIQLSVLLFNYSTIGSTVQLFNYRFYCSTIQPFQLFQLSVLLFNYSTISTIYTIGSTVLLFNYRFYCSTIQPFQLFTLSVLLFYYSTIGSTVQLFNHFNYLHYRFYCSTIQLSVLLFNYSTISTIYTIGSTVLLFNYRFYCSTIQPFQLFTLSVLLFYYSTIGSTVQLFNHFNYFNYRFYCSTIQLSNYLKVASPSLRDLPVSTLNSRTDSWIVEFNFQF